MRCEYLNLGSAQKTAVYAKGTRVVRLREGIGMKIGWMPLGSRSGFTYLMGVQRTLSPREWEQVVCPLLAAQPWPLQPLYRFAIGALQGCSELPPW